MNDPNHDHHDVGFLNSYSRVFAKKRFLEIMVVLMLFVQVADYLKLRALQNNWEQIIIPPPAQEPYKLKMQSASNNYLLDMSHYIVNLWGNVSPTSVDDKFEILLSLFHEESYPRYQERLNAIQKEIKRYSTISHTMDLKRPDPIKIVENHLTIKILRSRIVGATVKPPIIGTLEIDFVIEGGRFKIIDLEEKQ